MGNKESSPDESMKDLVLDLNFVPEWAREQSDKVKVNYDDSGRSGDRGRRREGGRSDRHQGGGSGGSGQGDRRQGGGRRPGPGGGRGGEDQRGGPRGRGRPAPIRRAPVRVDFMPERSRLGKVVHVIRHSKRAYDVSELAHRFMSSPALFSVKLTVHRKAVEEGVRLYQFKPTQAVFLEREACVAHAMRAGLAAWFDTVEVEGDAPGGQFPCVGRCTIGGELVGPPNHHSYGPALEKLRAENYPHMTTETLKHKIEMVHEAEVVEAWKEAQRVQTMYRLKEEGTPAAPAADKAAEPAVEPAEAPAPDTAASPDGAPAEGEAPAPEAVEEPAAPEEPTMEAPLLSQKEAEQWIRANKLNQNVVEATRVIAAGVAVVKGEDERIVRAVDTAALAEQESSESMLRALRPALRHMRLHFFKAGQGRFVTGVEPEPLHGRAVEEIEQTLSYLKDHPGASREMLLAFLSPGKTMDDDEVVHELSSLRWLIDKGHVIEFFDGSLAVPAGER